jgi:hypothetical protein
MKKDEMGQIQSTVCSVRWKGLGNRTDGLGIHVNRT